MRCEPVSVHSQEGRFLTTTSGSPDNSTGEPTTGIAARVRPHSVMLRRSAAATLVLLMLNVSALGAGLFSIGGEPDCDRTAMGSAQMADMPGMDMGTPGAPADRHDPAKSDCRLPWSPGCTSAGPCAPAAITTGLGQATSPTEIEPAPNGSTVRATPSVDIAPDDPPPRH